MLLESGFQGHQVREIHAIYRHVAGNLPRLSQGKLRVLRSQLLGQQELGEQAATLRSNLLKRIMDLG